MGLLQIRFLSLDFNTTTFDFLHLPQLHAYIFTLSIFTEAKLSFTSSPLVVECAWTMCLCNTIAPHICKMQKNANSFLSKRIRLVNIVG